MQVSIMVTSLEMACLSSALVPLAGQKKPKKRLAGGFSLKDKCCEVAAKVSAQFERCYRAERTRGRV